MEEKKKKISIYDIAKVLNTSGSTISRVLKDHPSISKKMKELVKKTAREMNYKPNTIAVNLKSGKSNTIGVVVPGINRSFFLLLSKELKRRLIKWVTMLLFVSPRNYMKKKKR